MSTMLYKVAAAIAAVDLVREAPDDPTFDFYALPEEVAGVYYDIARAAIEAMMEPTLAMRKASDFKTAEITYPAMIQAALKENA